MATQTQTASSEITSVFDNLNSAYSDVYSEGTLQTDFVQKLICRLPPGSKVLDIGCASGSPNSVLLEKAGFQVTGFDISQNMLKEAKQNVPSGDFFQGDAKTFRPLETFDAVVCSLVLLAEPSVWNYTLAHRIASWLKPGGILLFGTLDFNDFPVAPGCAIDSTGMTLRHTFMGTIITDSTFEPGEWIKTFRRAGLNLLECEQRKFDPRPGEIHPEMQCYFLAQKTGKPAMLGPYLHPYKHYPTASAEPSEAWSEILKRCAFDDERSWEAAGTWRVNRGQLDRALGSGTTRAELFWTLDGELGEDVASAMKSWRARNPDIRVVRIVQASPSNQVIGLVNSISHFLGIATQQHHGAVLSEAISGLDLSPDDQRVHIESMPAYLVLDDLRKDELSQDLAGLVCKIWFPKLCRQGDFIVQLVQKRLEKIWSECDALGQGATRRMGFDCCAVTIRLP